MKKFDIKNWQQTKMLCDELAKVEQEESTRLQDEFLGKRFACIVAYTSKVSEFLGCDNVWLSGAYWGGNNIEELDTLQVNELLDNKFNAILKVDLCKLLEKINPTIYATIKDSFNDYVDLNIFFSKDLIHEHEYEIEWVNDDFKAIQASYMSFLVQLEAFEIEAMSELENELMELSVQTYKLVTKEA